MGEKGVKKRGVPHTPAIREKREGEKEKVVRRGGSVPSS
jgi:hypothetical protein